MLPTLRTAMGAFVALMLLTGSTVPSDPPGSTSLEIGDEAAGEPVVERRVSYIDVDAKPVYYVVDRRPEVRSGPGTGARLGRLDFRQGVRVGASNGAWRLVHDVETGDRLGWVEARSLSNLWLLVDKPSRTLLVYRGTDLLRRLPIDVSMNPTDDKVMRGTPGEAEHFRIPEGSYFVTSKNPNSQYYRSFMLNYPNPQDADRGLAKGLISRAEHRTIVNASAEFRTPTFSTRLGGAIAIHGQGSGRQRAWTRGCVALRDVHIDMLWDMVRIGTPVLIR